jgi:hypothetical protein
MQAEPIEPILVGRLAQDPMALELARAAAVLAERYAREVVQAFELCPHLGDVANGLGAVCVVLDDELDAAVAARAVRASGRKVAHVVFPLATLDSLPFERFANSVADWLRADGGSPLVHATFHPEMIGGTEYAARLVGILRRSPDPLVQLIPILPKPDVSLFGATGQPGSFLERTYQRLNGELLARVMARQEVLRAERRRRYARFADHFGPFAW